MMRQIAIACATLLFAGTASAQTVDRAPSSPARSGVERRPIDRSLPVPVIRLIEKQAARSIDGKHVNTTATYFVELVNRNDYPEELFTRMSNGERRTLLFFVDNNVRVGFHAPERRDFLSRFRIITSLYSGNTPHNIAIDIEDRLYNVTARSNTLEVR